MAVPPGGVPEIATGAVRVSKSGIDAQGGRYGTPFLTISAALLVAQAGDNVVVGDGVYDESISIPANVGVRGASVESVTIRRTGVTTVTTLVTMATGSRLENVALHLDSATDVNLIGVLLAGAAATAKVRTAVVVVDQSAAPGVASTTAYGVTASGGVPAVGFDSFRACTINVIGKGPGAKRVVIVDQAASGVTARDSNFVLTSAGGIGDYKCVETNHATAVFRGRTLLLASVATTLAQTLGTLDLELCPVDDRTPLDSVLGWSGSRWASTVGFGARYQSASGVGPFTNATTTFTTALTLTTPANLPAGTYRLNWYYEASNSTANKSSTVSVFQGATPLGTLSTNMTNAGVTDSLPCSGFADVVLAAASPAQVFTVQHKAANPSTSQLANVRLAFFRVA